MDGLHLGKLRLGPLLRSEGSKQWLDPDPAFQQRLEPDALAADKQFERPRDGSSAGHGDGRAPGPAHAGHDQPLGLEHAQGFANRRPAEARLRNELPLGRQDAAFRNSPGEDDVAQSRGQDVGRARDHDRFEHSRLVLPAIGQ